MCRLLPFPRSEPFILAQRLTRTILAQLQRRERFEKGKIHTARLVAQTRAHWSSAWVGAGIGHRYRHSLLRTHTHTPKERKSFNLAIRNRENEVRHDKGENYARIMEKPTDVITTTPRAGDRRQRAHFGQLGTPKPVFFDKVFLKCGLANFNTLVCIFSHHTRAHFR